MMFLIFVLVMVLGPASCNTSNPPVFDVKCSDGFQLKLSFSHLAPLCCLHDSATSGVSGDISNVCFTNCDTHVKKNENERSSEKDSIFDHHGSLRESNELEKTIKCVLLDPLDYSNLVLTEYFTPEDVTTWSNDFLGYRLDSQELGVSLNLCHADFLIFSTFGKDITIKNCNPHERIDLMENSLDFKVTHPSGNHPGIPVDVVFAPTAAKTTDETLDGHDQVTLKPFESKINKQHKTCEVQDCNSEGKYSEKKRQEKKSIAIHNIKKRSIVTHPSLSLQKSSYIRDEFLKSTVKALAETLKRRRENLKREGDIAKIVGQTVALKTSPTDIPDSIDVEHSTTASFGVKAATMTLKNSAVTDLLSEDQTKPQYFSTDGTFTYDLELSTTETTQVMDFTESAATSSISGINRLSTEEYSEEKIVIEASIRQNKSVDDEGSSQNLKFAEPTEVETLLKLQHKDCVPKLRFTIMAIILGFILLTLFLMCCGMLLHCRKEKKRRRIDAFLLYNFGRGNRSDSF